VQKYLRGFLIRSKVSQALGSRESPNSLIYRTYYNSKTFGLSDLFLIRDENKYEVKIQSCSEKNKLIIRNLDLNKFDLKHKTIHSNKDLDLVVINRFK